MKKKTTEAQRRKWRIYARNRSKAKRAALAETKTAVQAKKHITHDAIVFLRVARQRIQDGDSGLDSAHLYAMVALDILEGGQRRGKNIRRTN